MRFRPSQRSLGQAHAGADGRRAGGPLLLRPGAGHWLAWFLAAWQAVPREREAWAAAPCTCSISWSGIWHQSLFSVIQAMSLRSAATSDPSVEQACVAVGRLLRKPLIRWISAWRGSITFWKSVWQLADWACASPPRTRSVAAVAAAAMVLNVSIVIVRPVLLVARDYANSAR